MEIIDFKDWREWWAKIKWLLISFRFLAFTAISIMLVSFWVSLIHVYEYTIDVVKAYKDEGILTEEASQAVITHLQTVLFDSTVGHVSVAFTAVMTGIIALKGVQFYVRSSETRELLKQANTDQPVEELKKWLPKGFGKQED